MGVKDDKNIMDKKFLERKREKVREGEKKGRERDIFLYVARVWASMVEHRQGPKASATLTKTRSSATFHTQARCPVLERAPSRV